MKFAFVTCVQIGLSCMKEIYKIGNKLELVISLKEESAINKSGRVFLKKFCEDNQIDFLMVENINDNICQEKIKQYEIDWLFIIGWSQIAKLNILNAPKLGVIGAHPTLLPQGRGRASIPWAIIKSLNYTGVSFFVMDEGVDTGKILDQKKIKLSFNESASSLYKKVVEAHMEIISKLIPNLINSKVNFIQQDESKASYWPERKPKDGEINLSGSVYEAERLIRATTRPYPGAFFFKNSKKIIIWKARILKNNLDCYSDDQIIKFKDGILYLEDITL